MNVKKGSIVMIDILCLTGGSLIDNRYWGFFCITQ